MNKQQLQQEIAELQKQLEEKRKALEAMPDKWEPKGGEWWVNYNGSIETAESAQAARNFGAEYDTRQQAEKAAKAMRAHNRLLAYVAEFAPDWELDWGDKDQGKSFVLFDSESKHWLASTAYRDSVAGAVYMPRRIAEELATKLNSGEVEL